MGNGNTPIDMITIKKGNKSFLLMGNTSRPAAEVNYKNIALFEGTLTQPVSGTGGVTFTALPMTNVLQMDRLDDEQVVMVQKKLMAISIYGQQMEVTYKIRSLKLIRLFTMYSLIFFACMLPSSCKQDSNNKITINWLNGKAATMDIPRGLLNNQPVNCLRVRVEICNLYMLGDYQVTGNKITFKPLVSFTRGLNYHVFIGKREIQSPHPSRQLRHSAVTHRSLPYEGHGS